jgi:hypothetical protein
MRKIVFSGIAAVGLLAVSLTAFGLSGTMRPSTAATACAAHASPVVAARASGAARPVLVSGNATDMATRRLLVSDEPTGGTTPAAAC